MSVIVTISINKECADTSEADKYVTKVKALVKGKIEGTFRARIANHADKEELKE